MIPPHILLRIAAIQAELAAIVAALQVAEPSRAAPAAPAPAARPPARRPVGPNRRPRAPVRPGPRWSFQRGSRYRVQEPNPFRQGASADRFEAVVARFGDRPFTYAELEALLVARGEQLSECAIVGWRQVAGRQRGAIGYVP